MKKRRFERVNADRTDLHDTVKRLQWEVDSANHQLSRVKKYLKSKTIIISQLNSRIKSLQEKLDDKR